MPRAKTPTVYILASQRNGTLYIGVTANLRERVSRHKNDSGSDFTREHRIHRLVWYETHPTMAKALQLTAVPSVPSTVPTDRSPL